MRLISILVLVSSRSGGDSDSDGGGRWLVMVMVSGLTRFLDLVPLDKTRRTWGGWDYVVSFRILCFFFFFCERCVCDVLTYYRVLL